MISIMPVIIKNQGAKFAKFQLIIQMIVPTKNISSTIMFKGNPAR